MDGFLSLKILDSFQKLFEKFGIDYNMTRMILKTKLILDGRRAPILVSSNNESNGTEHSSLIKAYLIHLLFGVFLAFFIYMIKDEMVRMIYFAGAFFFMTTMYLISDFSFVLLDTKDKNILMTKPIDSKTLSMAKVLHILIYMFRLNTFIAGPSLIALVMDNGLLVIPIFLFEILLMDLLIFLITAFIYLLVLRLFDGEILRNIINLIQILLTILVTVGYQIAVRMIDFSSLKNIKYNFESINYFNPIFWFGAPFEIIFNEGKASYLYIFTALLIAVPIFCFFIYLKLSKKMEMLLLKLEGEGKEKASKHRIEFLIGRLLNKDETSRQAFQFTNAMLRSDRSLKLKIYPALSTGVLLPILMIFNMGMSGSNYEISGYEYIYLYFNFLVFPTVLGLIQYSSAWKGAYVYIISGFSNKRELYNGLLQAISIRLLVPLIIFNSVIYVMLFKERFILDIIILILSSILMLPIIGKIYFTALPFSKPIDESNQKQPLDKFFMSLGVTGCFILLHFISYKIHFGTWLYLGMLIIGIPITWKVTNNLNIGI